MNQRASKNRRPFFIVLGLFFAPLLVAFAVYYGSAWRPSGTTNKGELITPAIPLPVVALTKADGASTDSSFLRDTWSLLYLADGDCTETCRSALFAANQAYQLLGKDMTRVSRVFLYSGEVSSTLISNDPSLVAAHIDDAAGQSLLQVFPTTHEKALLQAGYLYIVDPLGNLMMRYVPGVDPRDIYQDMKKLLNLSHIG